MIEGLFEEIKQDLLDLYDKYKDSEDISEEVKDNALSFIKLMSIEGLNLIEDIFPNPHGTISFDFGNDCELEIGNGTMSYFIEKSPIIYGNKKEINKVNVNKFNDYLIKKNA